MRVTIFSQYREIATAKALAKVLGAFGIIPGLRRLSSTLKQDIARLETDLLLFVLPSYWEIQPSFVLPLFGIYVDSRRQSITQQERRLCVAEAGLIPEQPKIPKSLIISVGTSPFMRPSLGLNLPDIVSALWGDTDGVGLGAAQLDERALLSVVESVTSVVRHRKDPKAWAEYLNLLMNLKRFDNFAGIRAVVRASLESVATKALLDAIISALDDESKIAVTREFFSPETPV